MPLSDTQVRNLKAQPSAKKYSDGGGLHLLVTPGASKLWRLQYRFEGKQKLLALGSYPAVGLADARRKRDDAKKVLAAGTDPSQHQKKEKLRQAGSNANTFDEISKEFLSRVEREGKAAVTVAKKKWLLALATPDLGTRPITDISAAEVLVPLRRIEASGNYETARRLRSTIGQVFRFAIATARAENDPTGGLKGALIAPTVTHRPAFTDRKAVGGLLRAIATYDGMPETKAALQLMAYLYPRPGELRQAEWPEFDMENAVWTIPETRAKMRREHRKPLPSQALAILKDVQKHTGDGKFVFPSTASRFRPMSENTLNGALRRLGFTGDEVTSHGFRATASSLLNESGKWSSDAIEAELAHVGADEVRRAYHRALYWDDRVKMAQWWADELDVMRAPALTGAFA